MIRNMLSRRLLSSIKNTHLQNFPSLYFHPITTKNPAFNPLSFSIPFSTHHQQTSTSPPLCKLTHKDWLSSTEVLKIFDNIKEPNSLISVLNQYSTRKDYKATEPLFTLVINKLADAQDFDSIQNIMEKLKHEKACRLSDDFFQNVIKKYGRVGGRIKRAIETLFSMPEYGTWPSVKTFNIVLTLLVSNKLFDVVHEVYGKAPKLGIEIEACTLNILIKGLCQNGNLDLAFQLLGEFPKQGCQPNLRTFSTLMHGLCEKGKVDEAFKLMRGMEKEGIEADAVSFNILISGLRKQGRVEEGVKLLERMKRKGCYPNAGSYQEVLYGLLDAKRFMDAKELMRRMISERVSPSFDSYKQLIHGFCEEKLVREVDWALKQMVHHGFVPKMEILEIIFECSQDPIDILQCGIASKSWLPTALHVHRKFLPVYFILSGKDLNGRTLLNLFTQETRKIQPADAKGNLISCICNAEVGAVVAIPEICRCCVFVRSLNDGLLIVGYDVNHERENFIKIWEFDDCATEFREVNDLGGCALFISPNGSYLLAKAENVVTWFKANSIYIFWHWNNGYWQDENWYGRVNLDV
ncbi:hypothetical protein DITRI_Ditri02bG0167200 [Diplodiscus trichospermus]